MSESSRSKKPSLLRQRVMTAIGLVAGLLVLLVVRGWLAAIAVAVCAALSVHEECKALRERGHHPIIWPIYAALILSTPLVMLSTHDAAIGAMLLCSFCLVLGVMWREKAELMDIVFSAMPLLTVALPALCLVELLSVQPEALQVMLVVMVFTISIGCDTAAYFVGSTVGGPKLCPSISPNKTISGAIGGLAGSVALTVLAGVVFTWIFPDFTGFPPLWANALVGLAGGVAAQVGDLFASMVKRYAGIKDFSHLFPGHGGMLDRLDSILFTSIVIYCYRVILLAL